jgi:ribosomal protein S4
MRLDTICFNLGFASTIAGARQLVNHGHILVNGERVNIPSFQCQINDIVGVKNKTSSTSLIENNLKNKNFSEPPAHLIFDNSNKSIIIKKHSYFYYAKTTIKKNWKKKTTSISLGGYEIKYKKRRSSN